MMLVWVLLVTALFVSDVAGTDNSLEVEETLRDLDELTKGPCDEGWFVYYPTRSCYRCFTSSKTWKDAEVSCNAGDHHGHLASVTSREHSEFISKVVRRVISSQEVWIGLKNICENRDILWSDQSSVTFQSWAEGSPQNFESCTSFYANSCTWFDHDCTNWQPYVCAYKYH